MPGFLRIVQITTDEMAIAAGGPDRRLGIGHGRGPDRNDVRAGLGQSNRDALPQPGARAGDHGDAPVQAKSVENHADQKVFAPLTGNITA